MTHFRLRTLCGCMSTSREGARVPHYARGAGGLSRRDAHIYTLRSVPGVMRSVCASLEQTIRSF